MIPVATGQGLSPLGQSTEQRLTATGRQRYPEGGHVTVSCLADGQADLLPGRANKHHVAGQPTTTAQVVHE